MARERSQPMSEQRWRVTKLRCQLKKEKNITLSEMKFRHCSVSSIFENLSLGVQNELYFSIFFWNEKKRDEKKTLGDKPGGWGVHL